ncbi:MAG: GyrI-like domain-containing protein, partial [Flavobacterium sp.]
YPAKTMGAGAFCSWESGSDSGNIKTYFVKENDSIVQKANYNGTNSTIYWKFKDTLNHTKVTVIVKGKMDILTKITCFFKGGIHKVLGDICELSLHNLDKTLDYEMKTYSIKVNGIVQRKSGYCLKQTVSCHINSISKNIKIIMPRMVYFFKKNKLPIIGKPYVIYDQYEPGKNFATISVCIPVDKQIFVSPESDITSGKIEAFTCLKTTLIGDYSHRKEAWAKAEKHIADNNLKINFAGKYIEVYSRTVDEIKSPSKWVTELYIPVFPKAEVQKPVISTSETTATGTPTPNSP